MASSSVCALDKTHVPVRSLFEVDRWRVTQCGECGLIMTGAAFEDTRHEEPDYYTIRTRDVEHVYFEWAFRWRWVLSRLRKHGGSGSLLDVGAGNGLFVKIAKEEYGWDARGIELSAPAVEFAKSVLGVEIERLALADVAGEFDAVTSFNVLEHAPDPAEFLADLHRCVPPDGLLAITTPSPGSIQARVKGLERWGMVCPPHHINIFTRKSLQLAIRQAGFEVLSYDSVSSYIRFLRRWEKRGTLLRGAAFSALRITQLGADHLVIARRTAN